MSIVRNTLGTALAGAAQGLNLVSKLLEATAKTLRPGTQGVEDSPAQKAPVDEAIAPPQGSDTAETVEEVAEDRPERGRVVEPPSTPVLDETPHVRTSESHVQELADKTAAEVIEAVNDLSTDELRLLIEFETDHKNRRTVLAAIEKALAPDLSTPNNGSASGNGSGSASRSRPAKGEQREIVLPEAGGVPTSGKMNPS